MNSEHHDSTVPVKAEVDAGLTSRQARVGRLGLWLAACLLLACGQALWAGYQLGVGNQSIQVPFLLRLHDPALFNRDAMVEATLPAYPSLFYAALSPLIGLIDLPSLYLALHLLTAAAVLMTVSALAHCIFNDRTAGLIAACLLLAGHHHALANETLYSTGFTHTWAVFPLGLAALAFFYRGWTVAAFLLAGALVNFHALEAGYLGLMMGAACVMRIRRVGIVPFLAGLALYALAAWPTLAMMLTRSQAFGDTWLTLMQLRSAQHSFPFTWWEAGHTTVPRFLMLLALAALAATLGRGHGDKHRLTLWMAVGLGVAFVAGILFTEIWASSTVIRIQLLRGSKFLAVIALVYIAYGCGRGWMLPFERQPAVSRWRGGLEFLSATLTFLTLAIPPWIVLLPVALVTATLVAWINRRLRLGQAMLVAAAVLVSLVAWRSIDFILPGLSEQVSWSALSEWRGPGPLGIVAILAGVVVWLACIRAWPRHRLGRAASLALVGAALVAGLSWWQLRRVPPADQPWVQVQQWAAQHTPEDALFLTPIQPGGFRIHARRSVVGEWRDGTQLYFSADFAEPWWQRMNALQPGMRPAPDGRRLLVRGQSLDQLDDAQLLELAGEYRADYLVLPIGRRWLDEVYRNDQWAVYRPRRPQPTAAEQADPLHAQQRFLDAVIEPGIAAHRMSDARVQVLDAQGRPVAGAAYAIEQTASAFRWGATLPPFAPLPDSAEAAQTLPVVRPAQLDRFLAVFNHTVIAESAWWLHLEPQPDQRRYEGLDRLVQWCEEHGVTMEFSFLSGFMPRWLRSESNREQTVRLYGHVSDLAERYAARIDAWQVTDLGLMADRAPVLMGLMRKASPQVRLGLGVAPLLHTSLDEPLREQVMRRGIDEVAAVHGEDVEAGQRLDFVAVHGRQPWGVWADLRQWHATLDAFAEQGVRVRVSQFAPPDRGAIEGPVRQGDWSPQLQADYAEWFLAACFAHPAVEAVNFRWLGPEAPTPGVGLLGDGDEPTPLYERVHELVTQRWRTNRSGQLPLDGVVSLRAFHGRYVLHVTTSDGRQVTTTFEVEPGQANHYRFVLDEDETALRQLTEESDE